jgi:lipid-A-disaccharide synthase
MSKVFIVAGEISGDAHGAGLMRALNEGHGPVRFSGLGGPQMRATGGDGMEDWLEHAAVLGLWEVLKVYGWFRRKFGEALKNIAREKPDAVVLIDYPGFNLRLAKALRAGRYPGKIIYYISPQVWAWKKGRVKTMARVLDLMICIFPFEKDLYEKSGLRTVFAGHPLVDRTAALRKGWAREPALVGFFPGSRSHEVARLFPVMLRAAAIIREKVPQARFAVSAANERLKSEMLEIIARENVPEARHWIEVGTAPVLMQRAEVAAVASGTATLEAACFGLPYVLVYKVNPVTYAAGKSLVRIKHLGIVNILAGETVVRELVQGACEPASLAGSIAALLISPRTREELESRLAAVVAELGSGGAYKRAAEAVAAELVAKSS